MSDGAEAVNGQDNTDPEDADRTQQETEASGTRHRSRVRNYVLPAAVIGVAVLILLTMYRCEGILKPHSQVPAYQPSAIPSTAEVPLGPYKPRKDVCRLLDMTALEAAVPLTNDLKESYEGPDSIDPRVSMAVNFTDCTRILDVGKRNAQVIMSATLYGSPKWAKADSPRFDGSYLVPGAKPQRGDTPAPEPWSMGGSCAGECSLGGYGPVGLIFWHENLRVTMYVDIDDYEAFGDVKDPESVRKAFVGLADQFRALLSP